MAQTKVEVVAINGHFTGSVQKIGVASGSDGDTGVVLDNVAFGSFINDGSTPTGSGAATQDYGGEINIKPGTFLEGPIKYFHVKDGTHSPAIVYYTDKY